MPPRNNYIGCRTDVRTKRSIERFAKQRRWTVAEYVRNAVELALEADRRDGDSS